MNRVSSRFVVLALAGALSGCGAHPSAPSSPGSGAVQVVAVERVYGDLARQLGSDGVSVTTILDNPAADPHEYEPTARDADAVSSADLVLRNGLGYDAFVDALLAASPKAGRSVIDVGALGGHVAGDNPHVWYEPRTLSLFVAACARDLERRLPHDARAIEGRRKGLDRWIAALTTKLHGIRARYPRATVASTEPVFAYVLRAAGVPDLTPPSFERAVEESNDPAPQDVATMETLLRTHRVNAFVYNVQTVEPATTRLLALAKQSGVAVVPVTETLPQNEDTQHWIDGEVDALIRAL